MLRTIAILCALLFSAVLATAQEKPKSVLLETACSGSLGGEALAGLRDSIRQSSAYRLVSKADDDGGYKIVLSLHIVCVEGRLNTGEGVASFASTVGTIACTFGTCNETPYRESLAAFLCSGPGIRGCGKDIYNKMDSFMSGPGQVPFNMLSKARVTAGVP